MPPGNVSHSGHRRTPRPEASERGKLARYYRRLLRHFGPQRWWPGRTRFEVILGALLTQNTSWANVEKALGNLRRARLLSAERLNQVPPSRLAGLLRPAGYFRQKTRYVRHFVRHLHGRNGGSPDSGSVARLLRGSTEELRAELLSLTGVGPETADSILLYAAGRPVFVIDAYTRRVLARHNLPASPPATDSRRAGDLRQAGLAAYDAPYEELQAFFHRHLPQDPQLFNEYHALLVAVGKSYCHPAQPNCASCPLGVELEPSDGRR